MNTYQIISVESRKGGVGKTTAALNLSTVLLKKGYQVLLLDIDITGTSISGSYNSSYWEKFIFPVSKSNKTLNLLELFSRTFLKGSSINSFSKELNNRDKYIVSEGKINIIPSEIFLPNKENKDHSELICDPRILFDELHSFWLTDMLKQLCENFAECMGKEKVVIVLDNAPGYIGLGKSIHHWLTDIGPISGKFLTVSSFDIQDINSCLYAIQGIEELINIKTNGANYYHSLKEDSNQEQIFVTDEIEKFFLKLATTENDSDYLYYRQDYCDKPSLDAYQSLIINKAPRELSSKNFYYDYSNGLDYNDKKRTVYQTFSQNVVYFENDIHTQFIQPLIRKKERYEREYNSSLKSDFTRLENQSIANQKELHNINLRKQISTYQDRLGKLLSKLSLFGFSNITELVEKRWMPETPFTELQQAFEFAITTIEPHLYEEFHYYDVENEDVTFLNEDITNELYDRMYTNIKENDGIYLDMRQSNEVYVRTLLNYIVNSFNLRLIDMIDYFASIMGFILNAQNERLKKQRALNEKFTLSRFLANENVTYKEIKQLIKHVHGSHEKYLYRLDKFVRYEENSILADLYNSFCHAQARLIDLNSDFGFLVIVLREVTINSSKENILYPNMKDILDKVIITKQIPHFMAEKELNRSLYRVKEMAEFQNIIERIIKKWGL